MIVSDSNYMVIITFDYTVSSPLLVYFRSYVLTSLSPHWGLKYPSEVQLSLYVNPSFYPYVCISVFLSVRSHHFLAIICTACNCAQPMRPQAMGSNPLSVCIICPSVRLSVRPRAFSDSFTSINSQCGDNILLYNKCIATLYPHTGFKLSLYIRPSLCTSVYLSISMLGRPC